MIGIRNARAWAVMACLVGALGLGSGCSGEKDGSPPPIKLPVGSDPSSPEAVLPKLPGGDEFAAGKKLYADNRCANCHKLGDTGRGGMMAGGLATPPAGEKGTPDGAPPRPAPNLTKVGAAPEHTRQWLAEHIRDAKKHTPDSRMPPFPPERISDADLEKLVEYLANRK